MEIVGIFIVVMIIAAFGVASDRRIEREMHEAFHGRPPSKLEWLGAWFRGETELLREKEAKRKKDYYNYITRRD
ncbi:hypothetical protein OU789_10800 [Halocynthiibacter sp. C4]|uniref:hypothetical protein n=1 Tax=Halocynthiibacter sp. C4 TaxID=2992758 RepID=UPI00237C446D|nr:hypothetical protein [Halocynthiibacter sp. C4]MDE0590415.1 hypothetical protein [Halocynthiibacter sp. C4]